ncbi:MAG: SOS response-associated peptidase family protein, partial [Acidimicrobiia bacterium]
RMPVVLGEDAWATWLDPVERDLDRLASLLGPAPSAWFEVFPVSMLVNKAANNGPDLVKRVEPVTLSQ